MLRAPLDSRLECRNFSDARAVEHEGRLAMYGLFGGGQVQDLTPEDVASGMQAVARNASKTRPSRAWK